MPSTQGNQEPTDWSHSNHDLFVDYYKDASASPNAVRRSQRIRDLVLRVHAANNPNQTEKLEIADIGCGPGAQSLVWASAGHSVHGIDVSASFVELARERLSNAGFTSFEFEVASATALPWESESMDICILPELLEHVEDWQRCLDEGTRILKPGGVIFLSTTNKLCPKQQEFNLPGYSWYPASIKRRIVDLSRSRYPKLAGYATYPAVNWFTPYELKAELAKRDFASYDRFDLLRLDSNQGMKGRIASIAADFGPAKWLGHVMTPYSRVIGVKRGATK